MDGWVDGCIHTHIPWPITPLYTLAPPPPEQKTDNTTQDPHTEPKTTHRTTHQVQAGLAIFGLSELGNLVCHVMLSRLRPQDGAKLRPIPQGFLFDLVSCPNYFFEVCLLLFLWWVCGCVGVRGEGGGGWGRGLLE